MTNTRLAVFDLDGVLIDSKELHYVALNKALNEIDPRFEITPQEHSTMFDGLSTKKKLQILHEKKGLPKASFQQVWSLKQDITMRMLGEISADSQLQSFMEILTAQDIHLCVASNSIRNTVDVVLKGLGISEYFSHVLSNEDVKNPKPHPEMYWTAMSHYSVVPENTVIFEDSWIGRLAAQRSGARLIPVDSRSGLTLEKIRQVYEPTGTISSMTIPWKSDKLNVLIPMAGAGSRFEAAGFTFPKPLIEVHGKPMIQQVVENLNIDARFIYIVQRSHYEKYNLGHLLKLLTPNCEIIQTDGVTEGAACTTLLASTLIDNDDSLIIANSDQFVEWDSGETIYSFMAEGIDGGIVTFKATHPKWSYVRIDDSGIVLEVAEKKTISDIATVGIYFWKNGKDYVKYANRMIKKNIRTNGEFYVCPVFNQAIEDGKKFRIRSVDKMWGLGTPEDLKVFLEGRG
jgi:HAD superfamily hydrolase (TIGR01509 family)